MPIPWIRFKRQGAKSARRPTSLPSGQSPNPDSTSNTAAPTPVAVTSTQVTAWTRSSRTSSIVIQARGTEQVNAWLRGQTEDAIIALRHEQQRVAQERREIPQTYGTQAVRQWMDSPSQRTLNEVLRARDRARSDSLCRRPTALRPPPPSLPTLTFQPLSDMIADAGLGIKARTAEVGKASPRTSLDVSQELKLTGTPHETGKRSSMEEAIPRPQSRLYNIPGMHHAPMQDVSDTELEEASILPLASGLPGRAREIEIPLRPEVTSYGQTQQGHTGNGVDYEEGSRTLPIRVGRVLGSRAVEIPASRIGLDIPEMDITDESRPRVPAGCSIQREDEDDNYDQVEDEDSDTDLEYEIVPEVEEPESPPPFQSRWSPDSSDEEQSEEDGADHTTCEISIEITPRTPPSPDRDLNGHDAWKHGGRHVNVDTEEMEPEDDEESFDACLEAWSRMLTQRSPVTPPGPGQQQTASQQQLNQQPRQDSRYLRVPERTYFRPRSSEQSIPVPLHPSTASPDAWSDDDYDDDDYDDDDDSDCEYEYDEEGTHPPNSLEAAPHLAVLNNALSLPESTSFERLLTLIASNISIARYLALNLVPSPTLPQHVVPQSDALAPTELRASEESRDLYAAALHALHSIRWPSRGASQALPHILEDIRKVRALQRRLPAGEMLLRPDVMEEVMALDHLRKLPPRDLRAEKRMSYAHIARLGRLFPLAEIGGWPDADHVIYAGKTEQFVRLVEAGVITRQQLHIPGAVRAVLGISRRMEKVQKAVRRRRLEGHGPSPLRSLVYDSEK